MVSGWKCFSNVCGNVVMFSMLCSYVSIWIYLCICMGDAVFVHMYLCHFLHS